MKRLLLSFVLVCLHLFGAHAHAQSNAVSVNSSQLTDSSGNLVSNATIYFAPVTNSGVPISFQWPGKGQAITRPISSLVSKGNFSVTLPNTSVTNPANVCFSVTVIDNNTGQNLLGPGYGCVQPQYSNSWCSGGGCNFDDYVPNLAALTVQQPGAQGPPGCVVGQTCTGVLALSGGTLTGALYGTSAYFSGYLSTIEGIQVDGSAPYGHCLIGNGTAYVDSTNCGSGGGDGGTSGVASINGITGPFTFSGSGVSCSGTTCTFAGGTGTGDLSWLPGAVTSGQNLPSGELIETVGGTGSGQDWLQFSSLIDNGSQVKTSEPFEAASISAVPLDSNGNPTTPSTNGVVDIPSVGVLPATPSASNTVRVTVPNSVTSYVLELPGTQPPTSGDVLSCTATNPSACTWVAQSGGSSSGQTPGTPTRVADSGAGSGPTLTIISGSNDSRGWINITPGSSPTASAGIVTIVFGNSSLYSVAPDCRITPSNAAAAAVTGTTVPFVPETTTTTSSFVITAGSTTLTPATTYQWSYSCTP